MNVQAFLSPQRVGLDYRAFLVLAIQLGLGVGSFIASFALRLDMDLGEVPWLLVGKTIPLLIVVRAAASVMFRLHRGLWRYVSVVDFLQIMKATTVGSVLFVVLLIPIYGLEGFPKSVFFLDWAGNIFLLSGVRLITRVARERSAPLKGSDTRLKRLLIVGAGDAGAALCKQALASRAFRYKPVALVDDDRGKIGTSISGIPVVGTCGDIPRVVREQRIDTAVIAIPSASPSQKRRLVEICQRAGVPVRIQPATPELLDGTVSINRIREVDLADLLGRPQAKLDLEATQRFLRGKRILITGAGGSVGSELVRQILRFEPGLMLLVDHAENPLFLLEAEVRAASPGAQFVAQVADVVDPIEMGRLMNGHRPEVVFHAAAHKHVPLMERSPLEAVKNNVGGTFCTAKCAQEAGVETFVLVSTDKAVEPRSVMGVTKRLAELLVREMNDEGPTQFVTVRFGNVLGSNASVVPIFKQQIQEGGPLTITHPEARRYFMSVSEAAALILQAGAAGTGGETFVLDMGEPVKIVDLAETLITVSGFKPREEIDLVFTGLRPGEKLSEELHLKEEELEPTQYEKLMVLKNSHPTKGIGAKVTELLQCLTSLEPEAVKARLRTLVPEYCPEDTTPRPPSLEQEESRRSV